MEWEAIEDYPSSSWWAVAVVQVMMVQLSTSAAHFPDIAVDRVVLKVDDLVVNDGYGQSSEEQPVNRAQNAPVDRSGDGDTGQQIEPEASIL